MTRLLVPAVRHLRGERDVRVDPHASELEPASHPVCPAHVAGPHGARESVGYAVRPFERLGLVSGVAGALMGNRSAAGKSAVPEEVVDGAKVAAKKVRAAVPAVKSLSHLPILADPNHAAGRRDQVLISTPSEPLNLSVMFDRVGTDNNDTGRWGRADLTDVGDRGTAFIFADGAGAAVPATVGYDASAQRATRSASSPAGR